ncbi:hypothetical protein N9042_00010 [bacterium]|nr:hypothetical protein [bacterium]
MGAFSAFANRLPDPAYGIDEAGQNTNSAANYGPGFASVTFSKEQPTMMSRTNSGRVVSRSIVGEKLNIAITYNPLTRAQFEPIYSFLSEKKGRLKPFFVSLPQYADAQDSTYSGTLTVDGAYAAGKDNFLADHSSLTGTPKRGDTFTITDSANSNHTKLYTVTRVQTNSDYYSGESQPSADQYRIYCQPNLVYSVANDSTLNFVSPLVRVTQSSDVREYSLGTNNLYSFSLSLEEAQP